MRSGLHYLLLLELSIVLGLLFGSFTCRSNDSFQEVTEFFRECRLMS